MTGDDIRAVHLDFADSCRLAGEAGVEGVELHGPQGYLLCQFSSVLTHTREDEYVPVNDLYRFSRETIRLCWVSIPPGRELAYQRL
jgi:2,4-dienoyl-CoA reductase-like NADH-dependent reductase (Old Yellow Enzyme family)